MVPSSGTFTVPYSGLIASILVGVIGSACFHASLRGHFVFDDSEAIVNNADIKLDTSITNIFLNDFWGTRLTHNASHKSYRPLTVLSFRLNVWLNNGNLNPYSFHLFNLILHGIATALTLPVFLRVFNTKIFWKTPLLSAVLFAVHPVHSEAVAGIVGRADLLCAVLCFLSLLIYCKATDTESKMKTLGLSLLSSSFAGLAMFAKEQGLTILAVCSAYDILIANAQDPVNLVYKIFDLLNYEYQRKDYRKNSISGVHFKVDKLSFLKSKKFKLSVLRHLVLLLCGSILLYTRWWVMGFKTPNFQKVDNPASFMEGTFLRLINYNYVYTLNTWLLLCPEWLCFDWSMGCVPLLTFDKSFPDLRVFPVILFWIVLTGLIIRILKMHNRPSSRVLAMSVALMVIPFSLATNLLFRVGFVIAERVLYLPSLGFCMIIAMGIQKLLQYKKLRGAIYMLLLVLLVTNILRCHERTLQWQNEKTLFSSGLRVCPLNAKVHYNLAKTSFNTTIAIKHYKEAIRLHPEYEQAMNNLANILRNEGNVTEAEYLLVKAVSIRPDFAAAWMNLGIVLSNMERFDEALQCYSTALMYRKNYPDCYYNLGNLFLSQKKYIEAYSAWRQATTQKPTHSIAWNNMIVMLDSIGKLEEAKNMGLEALASLPNDSALHFNLANTLGKQGFYKEAEEHFKQAISLKPLQALYHTNLGVLYHRWKRYKLAEEHYITALKINNNLTNVIQNLKTVQKLISKSKVSNPNIL